MYRLIALTLATFFSTVTYAESVILECNWSVMSEFEAAGVVYGSKTSSKTTPGNFVSIRKQLLHVAPANCVSFTKPEQISLSDYQQSIDGYLRPDQINLSCPHGFSPLAEPTWNNINSSDRLNGSKRYYLDSYVAKLTCLK